MTRKRLFTSDTLDAVAYIVLLLAVASWVAILCVKQLTYGLEFDESYLLGVANNLASGSGYVDDGVTFLSTSEPFSPVISTGPTVLIPVSLTWWIFDGDLLAIRFTMLIFFGILLFSVWRLFGNLSGRWASLAAVGGLALVPTVAPDLQNTSLMPGRVVGELPALALLLLAGLLLSKHRYFWSGLCLGLMLLSKLTFAIPAAALIATFFVFELLNRHISPWQFLLRNFCGVAAPLIAFELIKTVTLGPDGYVRHIDALRDFLGNQDIPWHQLYIFFDEHLEGTLRLLSVPLLTVVVVMIALTWRWTRLRMGSSQNWRDARDHATGWVIAALSAGLAMMFLWWFFRSQQYSARPALPTVLWLAIASCGVAFSIATQDRSRSDRISVALASTLCVILLISIVGRTIQIGMDESGSRMLAEQRAAASWLQENRQGVPTDGYWTNPELLILSGLPPDKAPLQDVAAYSAIRALNKKGVADAQAYNELCLQMILTSQTVTLCKAFPTSGPIDE